MESLTGPGTKHKVCSDDRMTYLNLEFFRALFALLGGGGEVGELGCDIKFVFFEALESAGLR